MAMQYKQQTEQKKKKRKLHYRKIFLGVYEKNSLMDTCLPLESKGMIDVNKTNQKRETDEHEKRKMNGLHMVRKKVSI